MDRENSIVQGKLKTWYNEKLLDTLLKRKSSKERSIRKLDTQNVVSVPFDWEMTPGTPKHPQTDPAPPLIKPSPALESQTLVIPSFASAHTTTTSCFWIKCQKNYRQGKQMGKVNGKGHRVRVPGSDNIIDADIKGNHTSEILEFSDVNVDSTSSSEHSRTISSSSSSVSTSSSSSNNSNSTGSSNSSSLRSFVKGFIKRSF